MAEPAFQESWSSLEEAFPDDDAATRVEIPRMLPGALGRTAGMTSGRTDRSDRSVRGVIAGKYRIEEIIESTEAFAIVRAVHLGLGHPVTLKYWLNAAGNAGRVARFLRHARTASKIRSEHVARIVDVGRTQDGAPFVVTEELSGWEFDEMLRAEGPLPIDEAVAYVMQACEAVAEGHARGIVHGALHLRNLMLMRRNDGSPLVKVLGFESSPCRDAFFSAERTEARTGGAGVTTVLPYLAPEQIRGAGDVDDRADIWALGGLLHTLLTGSPPFRGKTALALLAAVSADAPRPLLDVREDVSVELAAVIARCLEKDRTARYSNVGEFARSLEPFTTRYDSASLERISRAFGHSRRPPPLPVPRESAIVHVAARQRVEASAASPPLESPPAPASASGSRWLVVAAIVGAGAGALGAAAVGFTIRSQLSAAVAQEGTLGNAVAPAASPSPGAPTPAALPPAAVAQPLSAPAAQAESVSQPRLPAAAPVSPRLRAAVGERTPQATPPTLKPRALVAAAPAVKPPDQSAGARSVDLFDDTR